MEKFMYYMQLPVKQIKLAHKQFTFYNTVAFRLILMLSNTGGLVSFRHKNALVRLRERSYHELK